MNFDESLRPRRKILAFEQVGWEIVGNRRAIKSLQNAVNDLS